MIFIGEILQWIKKYQVFLFDFDGLLVNTEELHFEAYRLMCQRRGVDLKWNFERFCLAAHYGATDLQEQMIEEYPEILSDVSDWSVLYNEKKQCYIELLQKGAVHLMPGVKELLDALDKEKIKRAVVTHSPSDQINLIRKQNPLLDTIPMWITREQYSRPKPHPEAYLTAIEKLASQKDAIIGFEDTPRGLRSLMGTHAKPVLICSPDHPGLAQVRQDNITHYATFLDIPESGA